MKKECILGFDVINDTYENITDNLFKDINNNIDNFIVNVNPLIMMNFFNNKKIIDIFNKEKYQIADGYGTLWASKHRKKSLTSRVTGIDLMEKICEKSIKEKTKIFLCGSKPNVANNCKVELEKKYKGINIVGICDGYKKEEEMVKLINEAKPTILFVALGSPKQEEFIINNRKKLKSVKVFMPVGGSFDVISGRIKRAPKIYQKTHTEWLYRLLSEPKRIKSDIKLIQFIFIVLFTNK